MRPHPTSEFLRINQGHKTPSSINFTSWGDPTIPGIIFSSLKNTGWGGEIRERRFWEQLEEFQKLSLEHGQDGKLIPKKPNLELHGSLSELIGDDLTRFWPWGGRSFRKVGKSKEFLKIRPCPDALAAPEGTNTEKVWGLFWGVQLHPCGG